MKAEEYLQLMKVEIEENLKENPSMDLDEKRVSNYIIKIIEELKPNRYAEKTTKNIINKYFGEKINSIGIIPHYEGRLIECWLLRVLKIDDTYIYATNYLIQRDNNEMGIYVPLKDKNEIELLSLINLQESKGSKKEQPKPKTPYKISDKINSAFENNSGWQHFFKNETDFNTFVEILINYFENSSYNLPVNLIELKRSTKTNFSMVLHEILNNCSPKAKLINDTEFIEIIKNTIKDYNTMTDNEIYQSIIRN